MDIYHIWFDAKDGVRDDRIAEAARLYLDHLKDQKLIAHWRLMRRKLGLAPSGFREWHVMIETENLAQLERAFGDVATRSGETEVKHHGLNALACNLMFALYRDFPDEVRKYGEEKF